MTVVTDIPRTTWRAGLMVFLATLLAGLGIGGAAAGWSQQGNVRVTVQTGTWIDYTTPDWEMPLSVTATRPGSNTGEWFNYLLSISWTPTSDEQKNLPVAYHLKLTRAAGNAGSGGNVQVGEFLIQPGENRHAQVQFSRNLLRNPSFTLTITPMIDGVPGQVTTRTITTDLFGGLEVK